jgi:hypothetical protein
MNESRKAIGTVEIEPMSVGDSHCARMSASCIV